MNAPADADQSDRKEAVSDTLSATSVLSIAAPGTQRVHRAGGWREAMARRPGLHHQAPGLVSFCGHFEH